MEKFKTIEDVAMNYAKGVVECNPKHKESEGLIHTAVIFGVNELWRQLKTMDFSQALLALKAFKCVRRSGWNGKGLIVFRQVPASIPTATIPKMQSIPDAAKKAILGSAAHIGYTSQCLIYNTFSGRADSWVPSVSDMLADDWEVVEFDDKPICQA